MDRLSNKWDTHLWDTRRGVGNRAQTPRLILYSIPHTFSGVRGSISKQHYVSQPNSDTQPLIGWGYIDVYKTDTHCNIIFGI